MLIGKQEKTDTISVYSYYGTILLGSLPLIGECLLVKWMASDSVRENKRNLCKAFLILKLTVLYPALIITLLMCIVKR